MHLRKKMFEIVSLPEEKFRSLGTLSQSQLQDLLKDERPFQDGYKIRISPGLVNKKLSH